MEIRHLLIISLLSILLLAWCSSKESKYINILSWSFVKDSIHSVDNSSQTTNGSIKNITDSQPQKNDINITQQVTKNTILTKLAEIWAWMVSECEYKSDLYFSVDFNNLSLPTKIIDKRWNIFVTCDYKIESKYKLTPICNNLQRCKLVYVSKNNLRWYNPVDKYSISNNQ